MKDKNHILINIIICVVVVFISGYSLYLFSPPDAVGRDAAPTGFSAGRAFKHVREMCRMPHFVGTEEHRRVRDYIISECQKMGLSTEVQSTTAVQSYHRRLVAARVHNVIAILKGSRNTKSVLIAGHYDSMFQTPGAADDGSAVAAMMETARALKNSPPLQNDIVFLFTDGEELAMMGAKAFVDEHPLRENVGIVFNLEARGNKGTSVTFEVSSENGRIMKEYAKAIPYPFASSVMYEVYRRMPNNTDFTIFKNAGLPGFNAAFVEGYVNYHSMTDSPENLDLRSLQHHGSYILNFAKHFGNLAIDKTQAADVVFFNPIGSWLVLYPGWLQLPLLILAVLLFLLYLVLGIKQNRLTVKGLVGGFFLYLAVVIPVYFLYGLVQTGIRALYPHYGRYYSHNFYNIDFYLYLMVGLVVGLFSTFYFLLFKKGPAAPAREGATREGPKALETGNLQAGALTLFIFLAVFLYLAMPTAAYVMIFPLIFVLVAGVISRVFKLSETGKYGGYALLSLVAVLPAIALYVPQVKMLFVTFSLEMGVVSAVLLVILLGFLLPQLEAAYRLNKYALPVLALALAIAAFIGGHLTSSPSPARPLQTRVVYGLDADKQKAMWISGDLDTDGWNRWFFKESRVGPITQIYPVERGDYLLNDAPLAEFPLPVLNPREDREENGKRKLHFTLSSPRQAQFMVLLFSAEAGITRLEIDGKLLPGENYPVSGYHTLVYYAVPPEGIDVVMECKPGVRVPLVVVESKLGLPGIPGFEYPPMPSHIIPAVDFSHMTVVKKEFEL